MAAAFCANTCPGFAGEAAELALAGTIKAGDAAGMVPGAAGNASACAEVSGGAVRGLAAGAGPGRTRVDDGSGVTARRIVMTTRSEGAGCCGTGGARIAAIAPASTAACRASVAPAATSRAPAEGVPPLAVRPQACARPFAAKPGKVRTSPKVRH